MKKVLAFAMVLVLAFSVSAFAVKKMVEIDDGTPAGPGPKAENIVAINALSYLVGFFNVSYERKIIDNLSLRVRGMYWPLVNAISNGSGNFFGFGGDLFFYPMGKACTGWFVGPRYDAFFLTAKSGGNEGTWTIMMAGGSAGYRWVWEGGFEMGIGFGAWTNVSSSYSVKSGAEQASGDLKLFNSISPTVDYEIGWAF